MSKLCINCKHWDGDDSHPHCVRPVKNVGTKHRGLLCKFERDGWSPLWGLIGCGPWGRYWEARDDR